MHFSDALAKKKVDMFVLHVIVEVNNSSPSFLDLEEFFV